MKSESYIKLFRKITEWEHYTDGNTMRLFLHLLIMATHERRNQYGIPLKRGQCYNSSRNIAKELKICVNCVSRSIDKLRKSGEILTEVYGQGTIFTIVHYDEYQGGNNSGKNEKSNRNQPKGNGIGRTDF